MPVLRKNWKLIGVALAFIFIFTYLGFWQLARAHEKEQLLADYQARIAHEPANVNGLKQPKDWRFYRASLTGYFDNAHTFFLDNKTFHGKVGYEVYTPFIAASLPQAILVDRGFIAIGSRRELPAIQPIEGSVTILGMFNLPPAYVALGELSDSKQIHWPLRVEYIQLSELGKLAGQSYFPYLLILDPKSPFAYAIEWQIVIMPPEKHRAYALQWFAFALTLLIISAALGLKK